jgi:hypothetical protein
MASSAIAPRRTPAPIKQPFAGGLCSDYRAFNSWSSQQVKYTEILPKQNHISRVPDPAVLQFLEVTTPSSIEDFDGVEGKTTQNLGGK